MKLKDLILEKPVYKNQIELFIEGDENDADYVSKTHFMDVEEFDELLPALLKLYKSEKWGWGDFKHASLTEEEIDILLDYMPYGANDEIHTVTDIQCWYLSKSDSIRYKVILGE